LVEQSSYPAGSCARSRVLHRGYLETRELSRVPHLACHPATTAELQAEDAAIAAYLQWLPGSFLPGARPLPASGQIRRLAVRKPGLLRSDSNPRAANFRSTRSPARRFHRTRARLPGFWSNRPVARHAIAAHPRSIEKNHPEEAARRSAEPLHALG